MVQIEPSRLATLTISADHYADLPVGAGHRAIRSPRSSESPPSVSLLANQDSVGSNISGSSALTPSGSCDSLEIDPQTSLTISKDDLAKRAHHRVMERKRTEMEKKQEYEKTKMKKQEQEKIQKDQQLQLKQKRRREIYALNAILRQLQQEKMAAFIHTHKHCSSVGHGLAADLPLECGEAAIAQSIGV